MLVVPRCEPGCFLLNPPSRSTGSRTRNAVIAAGQVLGFEQVEIVNLAAVATPSVIELNRIGTDPWLEAVAEVDAKVTIAEAILAGWGTSGLSGLSRSARAGQVRRVIRSLESSGRDIPIWTVGGRPTHPSRWHQFVADKHARTAGGSFSERIGQVLVRVSAEELLRFDGKSRANWQL